MYVLCFILMVWYGVSRFFYYIGGIVDIMVYEVLFNLKLWEVYYVIGGVWGGIKVDDVFY